MNVDKALDAAAIVMESGGPTPLAEKTFARVHDALAKYDPEPVRLLGSVWRSDFVAVTIAKGGGSRTAMRRLGVIGLSLTRASEAAKLGDRLESGEIPADEVATEIERIRKSPPPYGRAATVLAAACAGAFLTQTVAGDYGAFAVAGVAAGCGALARSLLQSRKAARAAYTFAAALVSALIATAGLRLGFAASVSATLLGSIIYMVPGIALATGFADLITDRHMLTGVERIANAAFVFAILGLSLVIADALL